MNFAFWVIKLVLSCFLRSLLSFNKCLSLRSDGRRRSHTILINAVNGVRTEAWTGLISTLPPGLCVFTVNCNLLMKLCPALPGWSNALKRAFLASSSTGACLNTASLHTPSISCAKSLSKSDVACAGRYQFFEIIPAWQKLGIGDSLFSFTVGLT